MNGYKIVLLKAIFMLYKLLESERVCSGICSHRASCQGAFTVARSVVRELARRETRTAQFCTCTT